MSIRAKIILVLIPLIITLIALVGIVSVFFTRIGITRLVSNSLSFKSAQLENYTNEQWSLLIENDLFNNDIYVQSFVETLGSYSARTLLENESEIIFAYDKNLLTNSDNEQVYRVLFSTSFEELTQEEISMVNDLVEEQKKNENAGNFLRKTFTIAGEDRVGYYFDFTDLDWVFLITNQVSTFYRPVYNIIVITLVVAVLAIVSGIIVILLFSNTLVNPIKSMLSSMRRIIQTNNLNERVPVEYKDEVGELSTTFNIMVKELEKATQSIKLFAFNSIVAKRNENKIRNIFQKYVPNSVINDLFKDPTKMLKGQSKKVAIVFTDVRDFTTISEQFSPDELVAILNSYFESIVDVITHREGVIDKYIGDAVMAFFGSPVDIKNPPLVAFEACNEIRVAVNNLNKMHAKKGIPPFSTGIGLNYGITTVGNIGSEKKMDYTIIGDEVNIGSRLEGLTKGYGVDFIFSHSVKEKLPKNIQVRMVDLVQVKGKTKSEYIYTCDIDYKNPRTNLYALHNRGFDEYLARKFDVALKCFEAVHKHDPKDKLAKIFIDRCKKFKTSPPPKDWDGTTVMTEK